MWQLYSINDSSYRIVVNRYIYVFNGFRRVHEYIYNPELRRHDLHIFYVFIKFPKCYRFLWSLSTKLHYLHNIYEILVCKSVFTFGRRNVVWRVNERTCACSEFLLFWKTVFNGTLVYASMFPWYLLRINYVLDFGFCLFLFLSFCTEMRYAYEGQGEGKTFDLRK